MPLVILPAGLSELGTAEPLEQGVLKAAPVIMADGVNEKSKDFASMVYGADPIDEQVWLALNVLRQSGAAVITVGQRFQDIRKMTSNVEVLIEQEARTALRLLVQNGDISIERISVTKDELGNWAECVVDYINNRLPKPANAYLAIAQQMTGAVPQFGVPLPDEVISTMQAGIVVTGLLNIVIGLVIRAVGKEKIDLVLPPIVTGSVAAIIGFGLAFAALGQMASANFLVALVTLLVTVLFSVYLQNRGFMGMIPVLLGAITGYIFSAIVAPNPDQFQPFITAPLFAAPHITLPSFSGAMVGTAIFSIAVMAIATVPESTAHLYQISLYVDRLAEDTGREKYQLDKNIGFNLILDGIDDTIKGMFGSTAGTNYGENNSLMAITRNYSGPALISAGVIAILLGFIGKLAGLVQTVPLAVSGGLAIYLFGVIGMQGIALMQEHKVSMFDPRNLAIGAVIMIVGIGGNIGYPGGFIPVNIPGIFPNGLPAIATAAVLGILLNAIFLIFKPGQVEVTDKAMAAADD